MFLTTKALNTLDYVLMLLEKESQTILTRENANENRVHLYGVGQYWASFDRSAYLLEKMTKAESDAAVIRWKDYPFPIFLYCVHYEQIKELCKMHIMTKQELEYIQFITSGIDANSYNKWCRKHVADLDR